MVKAYEIYRTIKQQLQEAGVENAGLDARLLLQIATGAGRFDDVDVSSKQQEELQTLVQRRIAHEPLQYLVGRWPFLNLELEVGPGVLVPRPETEEVCIAAMDCIKMLSNPAVVDLCSGTGALALGIQDSKPNANVLAVEWDKAAYGYLCKNIQNFKKEHRQAPLPVLADALEYYSRLIPQSVDLIVSNPPYVTEQEYLALEDELYYEPKQALVAPEDGLLFYKTIAKKYREALKPGGFIVFEIGSGQGKALRDILQLNGYRNIEIKRDMNGNDRFASACL